MQSQDLPGGQKRGQEGYSDPGQRQQHQSWQQQEASDIQQAPSKQPQSAHGQHMPRTAYQFDHASDLALVPPEGNNSPRAYGQYNDAQPQSPSGLMGLHDSNSSPSAQGHNRNAQPQFMAGLMGLHGLTTPEEKRRREDKQKQYARELDEQVWHVKHEPQRTSKNLICDVNSHWCKSTWHATNASDGHCCHTAKLLPSFISEAVHKHVGAFEASSAFC